MRVKYNGETKLLAEWFHDKGGVQVVNGQEYEIKMYEGCLSVVNEKNKWICDCDSEAFKEEFEIIG